MEMTEFGVQKKELEKLELCG